MTLVCFVLSGLFLLPLVPGIDLSETTPVFWGWMLVLAMMEILAMLVYMSCIRDYPLALTTPYLSFTPLFAVLTGWLILGESISLAGLGGILLIVAGAWLLNLHHLERLSWRNCLVPFLAISRHPGSQRMLGVAFIYSLTLTISKWVMQTLPPSPTFGALYFAMTGLVALTLVGLWRPRTLPVLWRRPGPSLAVGALMALMVVTHFGAVQQVEAAYMVTVKRSSLLFAILYGAWWFREDHLWRNLPAGGLMLGGIALILLVH
jgi:drug/metabolite transporter (DMT)-like permease